MHPDDDKTRTFVPLTGGTMVSHYRIIEKIGAGGMGEVYLAEDTKLNRKVALKFLPVHACQDADRRSRFTREAQAAAKLNHPNIVTIYEVSEFNGRPFFAMEHIDGKTLRDLIKRKGMPLSQIIDIGIQLCEGLQEAHARGIIHRDIKPSNISCDGKGYCKLLDFGLAAVRGSDQLTKTGSTLGTASYMSPEQARGEKLDQRSDLWSFGVVLYEMVTGKAPFQGENEASILLSVVNNEPESVQSLVPDASPELVHIIRRALEKDPADRYKTAEDMLIDLKRLKKDTSRQGIVTVSGGKRRLRRRRNMIIAVSLLVVLGVAGYMYYSNSGVRLNPNFTSRWIEIPYSNLGWAGLSPDGKWVVFGAKDKAGKMDLYVVRATGGEVRRLTQDTSGFAGNANISPDGDQIVYCRAYKDTSEICIVGMNGGASKKIAVGITPQWSPDGTTIGYIRGRKGEFWTVDPAGTHNHLEFADSIGIKDDAVFRFAWSPDSRSVAWVRKLETRHCEIVVHDLNTHTERSVLSDKSLKTTIFWAPDNQLIYSAVVGDEKNLWMVPADGGTPVQITKGLRDVDIMSVSKDGRSLLLFQSLSRGHLWLAKMDGSATREEVFSSDQLFEFPDISPDGKLISMGMAVPGTYTRQLFVMNRDGTNLRQITSGEMACFKPRWSPDGKMISYYARGRFEPTDSSKMYVVNPHKLDVPRFVHYGTNQWWPDSVTLEMDSRLRTWQAYFDGRPAKPISDDSMLARTLCNGRFVAFLHGYTSTPFELNPWKVCRSEDWNGHGPSNAISFPPSPIYMNYDALYYLEGINICRIAFHSWKVDTLNVNIQGIDLGSAQLRTTADGKEMIYKTTETVNKLGVIENLFK